LHAEPVGGNTFLVVEFERGGDGTVDVAPCDVDDAFGKRGQGSECCGVQVEVVYSAAGALICDLLRVLVRIFCTTKGLDDTYHSSNGVS
jgi:hypothetical protein